MNEEIALAEQEVSRLEGVVAIANDALAKAQLRLDLLKRKQEHETELSQINSTLRELTVVVVPAVYQQKPLLVLPALRADHTDVERSNRVHLEAQKKQIVRIFRALSNPQSPYVSSGAIKQYIEENFVIPYPDYWMVKTNPREPERWWKNIYDKAIERLDLGEGILARRESTGKKGLYALKEYLGDIERQPNLPFNQPKTI